LPFFSIPIVLRLLFHRQRETYHVPFLPFPINLGKIETLILRPPTRAFDDTNRDASISSYSELRTEAGRRIAAERVMTYLSTLTRLVLVGKEIYEYMRNLESGAIVDRRLHALDEHDWLKVT
jgi:hypothetical protein